MSYVEESQRASSTVIFEATAENITAVYLDIKDLAASFTVYKIGEFTYYIILSGLQKNIASSTDRLILFKIVIFSSLMTFAY